MSEPVNYLAVDAGEKRIGLAVANSVAKLPRPLAVLFNDKDIYKKITEIAQNENISKIIVGLPRNMSGEETAQSKFSRKFAGQLAEESALEVVFADESLSTERVNNSTYKKDPSGYVDSVAACFILEEYLEVND